MENERLAVIDVGTNTFHLVIAEILEGEDFIITNRFKEVVKLGEGGFGTGKIAPDAFERGVGVLKNFRKLINSAGSRTILAFATSAVRGSSNGLDFIQKVKEEAGIEIRTINGNEEAAFIYEGVKNGVTLPYDQNTLLVDIGGGSVEFIVARENKSLLLRSLDMGAARAFEFINPGDRPSEKDIERTRNFFLEKSGGLLSELKQFEIPQLVGSSGSFETLGTMVALELGHGLSAENLNNYTFSRQAFQIVYKKIIRSTRKERLELPGMEPMRVDMILMSAILIDLLFEMLKFQEIKVSVNALKEGILFHYMDEKRERVNFTLGHAGKSIRSKSVKGLAKKFRCDIEHGLKVTELALILFNHLSPMHHLGEYEKELLRFAAMLHDIGYFVSPSGHHKHGQYIVMNSGLNGFSGDELMLMGNIIRYHRKSLPTRDHFHFKMLSQHHRFVVRVLAGILRISDNLDKGHRHLVEELIVKTDSNKIEILVDAKDSVEMEIKGAAENRDLLEQVFGLEVEIREV